MSRTVSFLLFFSVALSLVGGVHYYLWARLVRDPGLPPDLHRGLTILFWALFLTVPIGLVLARSIDNAAGRTFLWVSFIWLGLLLLLFVVVGALDLLRAGTLLGFLAFEPEAPADPERRRLLSRLLAGAATVIAGGMGFAALRSGLSGVIAREVTVRLARLPNELDGTTIVQLSDVHVGPTIKRAFIEELVRKTNALEPDVIAITGDLVDGSVEALRHHVEPLKNLRARYGVFFVTGNHEYYSGADAWCEELERLGIRVLRNERVVIGSGEASYDLAGIDDYHAEQFGGGHGADLARATLGRDPSRELVLLAHQPRAVFEAKERGVGLQLSGHTHGGQIWPWNWLVRLQQPVVAGLARFGETLIYVSSGTGYWGPPMRLGAPAEITRVVLLAPEEALA
ncbi:MAG TPA: metallophosphoesterase [Polyangiaceae bacterium]|nr:metallophosphoesterase [Polyangiaceae bacterium]